MLEHYQVVSYVTSHRSQVSGHRSQVTGHRSQVTGHWSQVISHTGTYRDSSVYYKPYSIVNVKN